MLNVLRLSIAFFTDDVSFAGLGERKIVQLVTTADDTLLRAVKGVENGKLTVIDISTPEEQTFAEPQKVSGTVVNESATFVHSPPR